MTRRIPLLTMLLVASIPGPSQAARRTRVALIPLAATGKGATKVAWRATASMAKSLRHSRNVQVVVLGQRRAGRLHQCIQVPDCTQAVSRRLGVQFMVAGHVTRMRRTFHVDMRIIRADGEVVSSDSFCTRTGKGRTGSSLALKLVRNATQVRLARAPSGTATDAFNTSAPLFSRSEAASVANTIEARDTENPLGGQEEPAVEKVALADSPDVEAPTAVPQPTVRREAEASTNIFARRYVHAWAALGAGVAALGVGTAFGVISRGANQAAQDAEYQKESMLSYDKAKKNALVANVLYGVGGAAVLSSAVMFFLEHRKEKRELRDQHNLSVQFQVAQSGAGLTVGGAF